MSFFEYLKNKYQIVTALPQLSSFDHNLDTVSENGKMYADVFQNQGVLLKQVRPGVTLRLYDSAVALLDERENAVKPIAFVSIFERKEHLGQAACVENYLWKDQESDLAEIRLEGLTIPQYTFFFLVDKFSAVISDQKHTAEGARWWKRQVGLALARGFDVFAENEFGTVKKIESEDHFKRLFDLLWGASQKFQMRLLVIAKPGYYTYD